MNDTASSDRAPPAFKHGQDGSEDEFIAIVGERVRVSRARRGLSRKALSAASNVSLRYLAQLESGEGNISIALLRRISRALDHRIEWLVGDEDPWTSDVARVASLFRVANAEQRRRVMAILAPDAVETRRTSRIALIGLRGAGKSTLGRMAADAFAIPFVELNREIEKSAGMPVHELMALYGQEGYRRLERTTLEKAASNAEPMVLAVAGGIVSEPDTFAFLLGNFHTIWLKAMPREHMERVRRQGDTRPMAGNPAALDDLKTILTSREALYARAEAEYDTSDKSVEDSLAGLVALIRERGFLTIESR